MGLEEYKGLEFIEEYRGFRIYREGYALVVVNLSNPHFVVGERVATYFGTTIENVKAYIDGIIEVKEKTKGAVWHGERRD